MAKLTKKEGLEAQLRSLQKLRAQNQAKINNLATTLVHKVNQEKETAHKLEVIAGHKQPVDFCEATEIAKELGEKTDMAARIAEAIFTANPGPIYEAMLKRILQGDSKTFATLAARAYGEPLQEVVNRQSRPFELVIKHIGQKEAETVQVIQGEIADQSEPAGDIAPAQAVETAGTLGR